LWNVLVDSTKMNSLTKEESLKERALQVLNLRYLIEDDIKASYRRKIFTYHPDRHPETKNDPVQLKSYEEKIMVINQAYELLQELLCQPPINLSKYCLLEDTALVQSLLPETEKPVPVGKTEQDIWIENYKDRF